MRSRLLLVTIVAAMALNGLLVGRAERKRLNPVIDLLEQHKPVFGLYAPSNGGGRRGGEALAPRPAIELAKDALAYRSADYLFNGSMEGGLERGLPAFADFVKALGDAAGPARPPFFGVTHPLIVKTPKIAPDVAKAADNINRQLNAGAAGIMFVEAESAEEARTMLASGGGHRCHLGDCVQLEVQDILDE